MANPFDNMPPRDVLKAFLNSPCPHGYSARKRCSKCQSAAASGHTRRADRTRKSVYVLRAGDGKTTITAAEALAGD